jgi:hypothetical protein
MNWESSRICSTCDGVMTDPHVHNVWEFYHPREIEQRPVTGLSLDPQNFAVIVFANWIDMGMSQTYLPSMGLS